VATASSSSAVDDGVPEPLPAAPRRRRGWPVALTVGLVLVLAAGLVAWRVLTSGPPTVPEPYRALVRTAAAGCPGLDERVLAAQLEQESGWNPAATSRVGAQGIAQFMPSVWTAYAVDGDGDGDRDVWDPRDAIPSAARFDCVLMAELQGVRGDPATNMLAAYNAGPDQVKRYGGVPPFPETRRYVERVLDRAKVLVVVPPS
jgi:soluble lytic murein transglycosylase-like protein